jgi:hypothetical protein
VRRKDRARTSVTGAALAVLLAGGAVACSGSAHDGGSGDGDNAGDTSATAQVAPPGRYHTLPEPCAAVDRSTLAGLFPGVDPNTAPSQDGASPAPTDPPYGGKPDPTYDTDRHVGCTWQHDTSVGGRRLSVDFERVVSYDTSVSDDEEATQLFTQRAEKVGLTGGTDTADTGSTGAAGAAGAAGADSSASPAAGTRAQGTEGGDPAADSPSPDPSGSADAPPAPRMLNGIGDSAYLDDQPSGDDGNTGRTVTLVFRTANVLVTVEYTETMTEGHRTPSAAELEDKAQDLAHKLVGRFDDI